MIIEKIICVTRKTRLEELLMKYGSERQARFHIEHSGGDFSTYLLEHQSYKISLEKMLLQLNFFSDLKFLMLEREMVKSYLFTKTDLIVVLGQDGLVANVAKYVGQSPIIAVNPDYKNIDGLLLPFQPDGVKQAIANVLGDKSTFKMVTLGEVTLNDGQQLLAFNDFFVGVNSHVSSRYRLQHNGNKELQASSGVIISTGVGSTGWMSSVFNMTNRMAKHLGGYCGELPIVDWQDSRMIFAVREPFISKTSQADMTFGIITPSNPLIIHSYNPQGGVIFSDGIENDYLVFNSGSHVTIKPSQQQAILVR